MKPTRTQRNMIDKDPLATHRQFRHMTQNALDIRAAQQTNWVAEQVRNYVSTIERDMDYKASNQPLRNNSKTRLPIGVISDARK